MYKNALFYQDRLGTNIGKALKKETVFSQRRTMLVNGEPWVAAG
jgi:hypothetical protein